jgi:hypothetical protein
MNRKNRRRFNSKRRAQMELMGVALIVILISLGMLFFVRFKLTSQKASHGKEIGQSEMAANFLSTLQDTNVPECSGMNFMALLQDCATYKSSGGSILCSGGVSACEYLHDKIELILEESLGAWQVSYFFNATLASTNPGDPKTLFDEIGQPCPGDRKVKRQPIPSNPPASLELFICD